MAIFQQPFLSGGFPSMNRTTPTFFEDDYSSNSGWTQSGSLVTVNSGVSGKVDGNAVVGGTDHRVWKDMGSNVSDTLWTIDIDYTLENQASAGSNPAHHVFIISDASTDPVVSTATQDSISVRQGANSADQLFLCYSNGGNLDSPTGATTAISVSNGNTYYLRINRTSSTNVDLEVYSNAARTTLSTSKSLTISGVTSLRYIHHAGNTSAGSARSVTYQCDNLKVYNNVNL